MKIVRIGGQFFTYPGIQGFIQKFLGIMLVLGQELRVQIQLISKLP